MMPSPDALISALQGRFAAKAFDPERRVDETLIQALIEVARLSPSSFGLQPYRLVVVQDRATLAALYEDGAKQAQVRDCSHLLVLQARRHIDSAFIDAYMNLISDTRGVPAEDLTGFREALLAGPGRDPAGREGMIWAQRQCYTVLGHLLLAATLLGVDASPMEGFTPARVDACLGDEATWTTTVMLALGYAPQDFTPPIKVRRPAEQFVRRL
jgi:nitroreductase